MRRALWTLACCATSLLLSPLAFAQQSPADLFGPLFAEVQEGHLFPDGKTFADAVPKRSPDEILAAYRRLETHDAATLRAFVLANFSVPGINDSRPADLRAHIRSLWPSLVRQPHSVPAGSSALPMSAPYIVPGGRFRELYYWDSYFTMLGLKVDGQQPLVESMLADFTAMIERYGHIPNGTRTYYLSRSQPPFFALMLDLSSNRDPATAQRRLAALRREYDWWMKGAGCLDPTGACLRVVRMPDGTLLNRYWDDRETPRDESWAEDVATAKQDPSRDPATLYRQLRAGAESGWDYSSRWLVDSHRLASIRTTDIVPIDLNSLMFAMEKRIARGCAELRDARCATRFAQLSTRRRAAIDRYLWLPDQRRYADWDRIARSPTLRLSAATAYPLFVGAASQPQAAAVARAISEQLLAAGGLRTTTERTGQQWDAPNGWAPLQWIAIIGLDDYGETALARDIAHRWLATVTATYDETGKMLEKYDVEERRPGGGGEYPTQDGFGWTNGVTSALLDRYPELNP